MKKAILFMMIIFCIMSFSDKDPEAKTFDNINTASSEYGKVLKEVLNFQFREEFQGGDESFISYLKSSENKEMEKKWKGIQDKLLEPYEIKALSPKIQGRLATVVYEIYAYDEGKIEQMMDESAQEYMVVSEEDGSVELDIEKYLEIMEGVVAKMKKIKVSSAEIEFEKVGEKWMLKEKGNFEN